MPLQFISMPLPSQCISELFVAAATHINSTQCLRYAILGFAKPLRLNTNLCNTLAIQLISIHHLCYAGLRQAIADRNRSSRFSAVPLLIGATLCRSVHLHCGSKRLSSNLRLSRATHRFSFALRHFAVPCGMLRRCDSTRVHTLPLLFNSEHCISLPSHYTTYRCCSLPLLCGSARITTLP